MLDRQAKVWLVLSLESIGSALGLGAGPSFKSDAERSAGLRIRSRWHTSCGSLQEGFGKWALPAFFYVRCTEPRWCRPVTLADGRH